MTYLLKVFGKPLLKKLIPAQTTLLLSNN